MVRKGRLDRKIVFDADEIPIILQGKSPKQVSNTQDLFRMIHTHLPPKTGSRERDKKVRVQSIK